ncbi:formin-like protein 18 [Manihot esculenta]|uniref:formin-like protein 18 n=1 Tax=Manihot esculenta TaxID=3983 RepID=UPI001CC4B6EE|nr:formin-like protein 18 [Manihot esculenta]
MMTFRQRKTNSLVTLILMQMQMVIMSTIHMNQTKFIYILKKFGVVYFFYYSMRGRGRVSKPRGRVQLPASASQEDANTDDGQEHEAHIPRAPTGFGDTELQIWVPLASSVQPSHIDRSYTPVTPSADAQLPRPLPPPHRHSLHPHHTTAAPRPPVSHTHSPHSASPSGTASARGTGSASASTPSSAPASAPA